MTYRLQPQYIGKLQAIIFDWAGTTFDFGSIAPIIAFQQLFTANDVPITAEEARLPMGAEKKSHIRQLLSMPRIQSAWQQAHNGASTEQDIERLYQAFIPFQIEAIRATAKPIPGLLETLHYLQSQGYKIGSNTGYSREMFNALKMYADAVGFQPDSVVCAPEVPRGRPYPDMSLKNILELGVDCMQACVKVDDTVVGIQEGLNAGLWTIGVAISGNEVGLSETEWHNTSADKQAILRQKAYKNLYAAGAHYVIDSVSTLSIPVQAIESRLSRGEKP